MKKFLKQKNGQFKIKADYVLGVYAAKTLQHLNFSYNKKSGILLVLWTDDEIIVEYVNKIEERRLKLKRILHE